MPAEVWCDLIQGLCDEAQCFGPRMRYHYFLSGLRNKEWKTALSTAMVNSIQQTVDVLLYKNMDIPVKDDADFADVVASTSKNAGEGTLLTQMLQVNQSLILQQQRELAQSPRRSNYAATAFENAAPPTPSPIYPQRTPANVPQGSVASAKDRMCTRRMDVRCADAVIIWAAARSTVVVRTLLASIKRRVATLDPSAKRLSAGMGTGEGTTCPTMKAFMQSTAPNAPAGAARQGPRGTTLGGYVARVLSEADDEDWNVPVNEDEAEASHTFDYNEETVENNYDNVEIWNRADESSAVRYEDELTTMETTNEERPVTMGYDTTTGERLPSERAAGVLTTEEVAYDPENDDIVNEESSERAPGVLTTEEVAFDLEQTYLRTEEPSERAIGELTTE
ncbi:hypothetical protein PF004_g19581 [Phytophthora fragariae]|uniref:Uncharacterized protein n=1 Tax=Phytophthora fragariae TaxID=53985 RepID=A0A6G0N8C5_9STRA|nr:hypothetical protein PF004_g19581 [Phytophthora fragariae]